MRSFRPEDADQVLALNADCQPEVGPMDEEKLRLLVDAARCFWVIDDDHGIAGFCIGLDETSTTYQSPNYRWFQNRHETFAYVDRIAIDERARGLGLGQQFYRAFAAWAVDAGKPFLTAEVNTLPDNPASHRFHQRFGFVGVERRRPYGPDEEVLMYELGLDVPVGES